MGMVWTISWSSGYSEKNLMNSLEVLEYQSEDKRDIYYILY